MSNEARIEEKMRAAGMGDAAVSAFLHNFRSLSGSSPLMAESSIEPVRDLPDLESLTAPGHGEIDPGLLQSTVVIKLNGGLGTGMGLQKAKSLLEVRDGLSFLDLIAKQVLSLREKHGDGLRFLLMNSFSTNADTREHLSKYPDLGDPADLEFVQNMAPKIDADSLAPAEANGNDGLEWCPPGHGDLYPAILASGKLDELLAAGVKYAFVSNSDNLGATLDGTLLKYFAESDQPFMMEVTRRTPADRKGGHLAVDKATGGLCLRESAQCADDDEAFFQDINRHKFFNTNNLWLRLDLLKEELDKNGGYLPLAVIRNKKTLDPRDGGSTPVLQLETAMGAAISCFEGAGAINVPRRRFAPVKTTDDLLSLRSDAYVLTEDFRLQLHPDRQGKPPTVKLDKKHYKLVDGLERALEKAVPSLMACEKLEVTGPAVFGENVRIEGEVSIENASSDWKEVPGSTYVNETITL
ncbi:MAG: UTP--glucose-1-phosphate uridylyltransferase [Verrucomicrobiota bacterium]